MGGSSSSRSSSATVSSRITDRDRAILEMKVSRDSLTREMKRLREIARRDQLAASALLREGKRDDALSRLRRSRLRQVLAEKTDEKLFNLFTLLQRLESASLDAEIVQSMDVGTRALELLQKECSVERVQSVMERAEAAISFQQEISSILSIPVDSLFDSDEIERELDALSSDTTLEEQIDSLRVPSTSLPSSTPPEQIGEVEGQDSIVFG